MEAAARLAEEGGKEGGKREAARGGSTQGHRRGRLQGGSSRAGRRCMLGHRRGAGQREGMHGVFLMNARAGGARWGTGGVQGRGEA